MSAELQRQQALLTALQDGFVPAGWVAGRPGVARGLHALRDNAAGLAVRSLAQSYPALQEELGEAQFASLAWVFWRAAPPQRGDLAEWGAGLADFMAARPEVPAALVDLARRLWARHQAERAADASFDAASLVLLSEAEPDDLRLVLAAGMCVLNLSGEPLLVWRQGWRAVEAPLSASEALFMQTVLTGSLGGALNKTLAAHPTFEFAAWLARSLAEGWLLGAAALSESTGDFR